ncbi:hypothetical protein ACFLUD_03875 [Chloroflexota bacterium]
MKPKYQIGQNVIVRKFKTKSPLARDSDIGQYAGQQGTVTNYYGISPNRSEVFYIYTIRIGTGHKEIVLHEDEIKADKTRVH